MTAIKNLPVNFLAIDNRPFTDEPLIGGDGEEVHQYVNRKTGAREWHARDAAFSENNRSSLATPSGRNLQDISDNWKDDSPVSHRLSAYKNWAMMAVDVLQGVSPNHTLGLAVALCANWSRHASQNVGGGALGVLVGGLSAMAGIVSGAVGGAIWDLFEFLMMPVLFLKDGIDGLSEALHDEDVYQAQVATKPRAPKNPTVTASAKFTPAPPAPQRGRA